MAFQVYLRTLQFIYGFLGRFVPISSIQCHYGGEREMKLSVKYSGREHEKTGHVLAVKWDARQFAE